MWYGFSGFRQYPNGKNINPSLPSKGGADSDSFYD
jgi:hypothetical protein